MTNAGASPLRSRSTGRSVATGDRRRSTRRRRARATEAIERASEKPHCVGRAARSGCRKRVTLSPQASAPPGADETTTSPDQSGRTRQADPRDIRHETRTDGPRRGLGPSVGNGGDAPSQASPLGNGSLRAPQRRCDAVDRTIGAAALHLDAHHGERPCRHVSPSGTPSTTRRFRITDKAHARTRRHLGEFRMIWTGWSRTRPAGGPVRRWFPDQRENQPRSAARNARWPGIDPDHRERGVPEATRRPSHSSTARSSNGRSEERRSRLPDPQ